MTEMPPPGHGTAAGSRRSPEPSPPLTVAFSLRSLLTASEPTEQAVGSLATPAPSFDTIYEQEFEFVWRNLRRLAVPEASLRDVAQDVFLVIHRRLPEFEGRAPLRSW